MPRLGRPFRHSWTMGNHGAGAVSRPVGEAGDFHVATDGSSGAVPLRRTLLQVLIMTLLAPVVLAGCGRVPQSSPALPTFDS